MQSNIAAEYEKQIALEF